MPFHGLEVKQVIVVRTDLEMGRGKIAAQAAHASIESFLKTQQKDSLLADNWLRQGMPKIVLRAGSQREITELFNRIKGEFPCAIIHDAGHTQVRPGTITALGIGPVAGKKIDAYTGSMKLL